MTTNNQTKHKLYQNSYLDHLSSIKLTAVATIISMAVQSFVSYKPTDLGFCAQDAHTDMKLGRKIRDTNVYFL